ncbi:dihydropteroate synthase [Desulfobacca acetoxidans]|uniref:Dihydropteroate synthase DHPS n=1 Tax=Desulfobacca acetoxidans (strain ATCC 700848 / DSM 11109 / ASRB2) TaxID=880072 RepID=F2ND78_DESAR|nr:dihydropteroate synthase [Desulfobacca acetoxidans]AEB09802.1 dihydropteroate synthase DHPS [Desulfobacca acetoxidans DSM 11109]
MSQRLIRIGENLNVVTKRYGEAMKNRDKKPLQELAMAEAEKGVDYIDLNIGPARKGGEELMEWVVKTVQEVVPNIPLALDTSNIAAMEAGLKVHKGKALINSIMARPERMDGMMPLVRKYDAYMIGLLWGPEGMPRDEHERGMLTAEILAKAAEYGIENEDIWFDPIIAPLNIQQQQLVSSLEFMKMLQDMAPGSKSTCGLSNSSNGVPDNLRPVINITFAVMLQRYGMYSAIVDAFDDKLKAMTSGEPNPTVDAIYKAMDGEAVDMDKLDQDGKNYIKTVRCIMGQTLFSDSWLEV